jgi:outer membrane protein
MRRALLLCLTLLAPAVRAADDAAPPAPEAIGFDQAVERAVRHATSSALAAQEIARAEALLQEVRAGALPVVSGNATYTRIDAARYSGPVKVVAENQLNANLALSAPLVAASRWYQWSHAGDQAEVARASERDVRRAVALSAARAYLTIVAQKRAVEVSQRAVRTSATHYDYSHTRRLGGVGNLLDELRADQQLATAQAQLENALAGLARAQEALGVATGGDAPLDALGEPDLSGAPATAAEGQQLAEEGRTDVLLARRRADAAHRLVEDSWADWLPTLSLGAQAYLQDPPTTSTPRHGWQAQLLLSIPLYEGGLRAGQRRERQALDEEARLALEGSRLQARADVRVALSNLQRAQGAWEQSRRAAERATSALSVVEQAFQAGATTSLDVTDAERTARDADTAAVVAEDAVRQSRLDLLAAVGRFPN